MEIDMETTYRQLKYHFEGRGSKNNEEGLVAE
jgi:hypothetical protein